MTARQTRSVEKPASTPNPGASKTTSIVQVRSGLMTRLGVAARLARSEASARSERLAGLHTERLVLRPLRANDRDEFLRVLRRSRVSLARFCPLEHSDIGGASARDEDVFARHLTLSNAATETGKAYRLSAFEDNGLGRLLGAFNVNDIERGLENRGELVCWLSVDAQNHGYAEEGLRAIIAHALADLPRGLGLQRLTGLIAPDNSASERLAKKTGMSMCPSAAPVELTLGDRRVRHNVWEIFASVPDEPPAARNAGDHVVEGKPSIGEGVLGRGLLSILRTEGDRGRVGDSRGTSGIA